MSSPVLTIYNYNPYSSIMNHCVACSAQLDASVKALPSKYEYLKVHYCPYTGDLSVLSYFVSTQGFYFFCFLIL